MPGDDLRVVAVISIPRLGWNDFWGAAKDALDVWRVPLVRGTGAFWEQHFANCLVEALKHNPTHILTLDYDSIFTAETLRELFLLGAENRDAHAIAPIQASRGDGERARALLSLSEEATEAVDTGAPLVPAQTAHFGCTLLRADALRDLPQPWLWSQPAADGSWGSGKTDADIFFWKHWRNYGNSLFIAPRIVIGHLEVMVRWPDRDLRPIWQHPAELKASGPPANLWQ